MKQVSFKISWSVLETTLLFLMILKSTSSALQDDFVIDDTIDESGDDEEIYSGDNSASGSQTVDDAVQFITVQLKPALITIIESRIMNASSSEVKSERSAESSDSLGLVNGLTIAACSASVVVIIIVIVVVVIRKRHKASVEVDTKLPATRNLYEIRRSAADNEDDCYAKIKIQSTQQRVEHDQSTPPPMYEEI